MEQAEELKKIVESIQEGYWFPMAIVGVAFSIVMGLLVYIWRQMLNNNERRHQEHEKANAKQDIILENLVTSINELKLLNVEIRTEQKMQKK